MPSKKGREIRFEHTCGHEGWIGVYGGDETREVARLLQALKQVKCIQCRMIESREKGGEKEEEWEPNESIRDAQSRRTE